jgi:hypothetical protein
LEVREAVDDVPVELNVIAWNPGVGKALAGEP